MDTMRLTVFGIFALLLLQPVEAQAGGVADANNETPVRYVICGLGESDCFVLARFKDFETCERHKEWSAMSCDWVSTPGTMVCKNVPSAKQLAQGYCTK